jgi:hypothetical protein
MLVYLDYADMTTTTHECTEIVLRRFVGPAWRIHDAEAQASRPSHVGVVDWQVRPIPAPKSVTPR